MEKLEVKCEISHEDFTKKCSISSDCGNYSKEDILSAELDSRLSLKGANGLINGLKSDSYSNKKCDTSDGNESDIQTDQEIQESQVENSQDGNQPNLPTIEYVQYESELQMPMIMKIIQKDLSEPYSIYTYRYFIYNWPKLCFLVCLNFYFVNVHIY